MKVLALKLGSKLNKKELGAAMAEMDADGNGTVDFEEFKAWWAIKKEGQPSAMPNLASIGAVYKNLGAGDSKIAIDLAGKNVSSAKMRGHLLNPKYLR